MGGGNNIGLICSVTYVLALGDGNYIVKEPAYDGSDILVLEDLNLNNVTLNRLVDDPGDINIITNSSGESITVDNMAQGYWRGIE